ncbi:MAG: glycosyl transferase [Fluviicola sp.]|nr:MAG: glycosyl transferase [Fluviicola sp.]
MTKILVIRFSSIGDIVLTTPVIRCLKSQIENVELHILTKQQYSLLFESNPNVDKIHKWGKENKEVIKALKTERFDYIIDLHNNIRTKKIKSILKSKSYSFPKLNVQKWLYVNFKWNNMPDIHIVDRYFEAVKPLSIENDQQGLDFFLPKKDEVDLSGQFGTTDIVSVAIGAQFATKKLPVSKMVEVLSTIETQVVLLGGKEDHDDAEEIIKSSNSNIINACGALNLNQSASVVKQSKVLLTHDTGLMHIAAAFKTPIVSVWGNTVPEFGMYPYVPQNDDLYSIHEVEGLACRPCSKIGFQKCPKKHFNCMNQQNVEEIVKSIESHLS